MARVRVGVEGIEGVAHHQLDAACHPGGGEVAPGHLRSALVPLARDHLVRVRARARARVRFRVRVNRHVSTLPPSGNPSAIQSVA